MLFAKLKWLLDIISVTKIKVFESIPIQVIQNSNTQSFSYLERRRKERESLASNRSVSFSLCCSDSNSYCN